jgi:predicted ATPase
MSSRDPKVSTCTLLGICLTILGYPQSGAAKSQAGIEHAEALNHSVSLNLALRRACVEAMLRRDVDAVAGFAARLAALRAEYETYKGMWEGTFFQDWAQLSTQSAPELFDRMQSFLNHLDAVKNWAFLPWYMASTAELGGRYGAPAAAAALLERAAELANTTGARWWQPEITRLQARVCARDHDSAVALFETGLAQAREQGAKLWELRIAVSLAELGRDAERRAAARDVLEPVCEWFREGRNMPDYVAARALLAEIS